MTRLWNCTIYHKHKISLLKKKSSNLLSFKFIAHKIVCGQYSTIGASVSKCQKLPMFSFYLSTSFANISSLMWGPLFRYFWYTILLISIFIACIVASLNALLTVTFSISKGALLLLHLLDITVLENLCLTLLYVHNLFEWILLLNRWMNSSYLSVNIWLFSTAPSNHPFVGHL